MALTKGIRFANLRKFVDERFPGEAVWEELLEALDDAAPSVREATATDWLDLGLRARLVRALCRRGPELARALGRFEADRDFSAGQRWFLRLMPPMLAIRNMNLYWARFEDTGTWTSEVRGGEIEATLDHWDPMDAVLCEVLAGYLECTLALMGGVAVVVVHSACRRRGARSCSFITERFAIQTRPRLTASALSHADLVGIRLELENFEEVEDVLGAMMTVLHIGLSLSYVAVRLDLKQSDESRHVGARSGGSLRRFVLPSRGIQVGVVDLEGPVGETEAELLDDILRIFADALRRACPVAAAAKRWKLSAQQRNVLELLVQGLRHKAIADRLGITEKRAEKVVNKLKKLSGAKTVAQIAARAYEG